MTETLSGRPVSTAAMAPVSHRVLSRSRENADSVTLELVRSTRNCRPRRPGSS